MNFIFRLIIFVIISIIAGFIDAFFIDRKINITWAIYFTLGWIGCLII